MSVEGNSKKSLSDKKEDSSIGEDSSLKQKAMQRKSNKSGSKDEESIEEDYQN